MKKITPDQLRDADERCRGPLHHQDVPDKRSSRSSRALARLLCWQSRRALTWCRCTATGCAAASASAIFNHRTDEYGGSAENRARFAVEAVKAVHAAVPGMAIDYKLAVRQENPHYGNAGVVEEELAVFVPAAGAGGRDQLPCDTGQPLCAGEHHPAGQPPRVQGRPAASSSSAMRCAGIPSVPLCGVGGLNDPDFVEQQLASGRIQCAAMSRQLLADPDWVNKLQSGQCGKDPPLCPLQQKVPGRPDRPSGHPLYL